MRTKSALFLVSMLAAPLLLSAQTESKARGALFVGNIADACTTSAMSAGILTALRDKGASQAEAESKVAELLANDPNRDFYVGLTAQNSKVVFGFPAVPKTSQEQIALARCARFAKSKPVLAEETVVALMPAVVKCQVSTPQEVSKCVFSVVYEAQPQ
jgi:hypothetical protein